MDSIRRLEKSGMFIVLWLVITTIVMEMGIFG